MNDVFFIIGCPRSGTTAYAHILNTASNALVHVEEPPQLRIESRSLLMGTLDDPEATLRNAKRDRIAEVLASGKMYGDKNPCYLPFIPLLVKLWDAKLIALVRDGRDVVRSLIDWHELHARNIFAMAEDENGIPHKDPEEDPWDYSRMRPLPSDPLHREWKSMSRFCKCAWYWAAFTNAMLDSISALDDGHGLVIDPARSGTDGVKTCFEFLGLQGFDETHVGQQLTARINSLPQRSGHADSFPSWSDWTPDQTEDFDRFAAVTMQRAEQFTK